MLINAETSPVGGKLYQFGVDDYSRILGLTNWKRLDTDYIGRYRNWEGRIANRNAFAQWGAIHLEIIEPGVGNGNAMEWLQTRGPGMFHVGVAVDDVRIRPDDLEVVFEVKSQTQPDGSPAIVHLDTVTQLGYFIELAYRPLADALSAKVASPDPWS
jgi:methylmalonyl-CoA/ethylmalonyl-CoA epimerase